MNTYVIHATCRYVVKSKADGRCENGQYRPTIAIDAGSEATAIRKATAQEKKRTSSAAWPVVSFALIPELVNVIEHPTPAQKRVLQRMERTGYPGCDAGMTKRLEQKGWIARDFKNSESGYVLTAAGRREVEDR